MRAHTKGKHEMGKRFAIAAASVMVAAGLIGAVAATAKNVIQRPNGHKVPYRAMGKASSNVSLDIFGAIDRQGAVTYAFGGDISAQARIRRVRFAPEGPSRNGPSGAACREYRTVTLFRVEPNGTSTRVASLQTGQGTGEFGGPLLERPLGEITGYYYAEVAPATSRVQRHDPRGRKAHRHEFYKLGDGGYYKALTCLPARSPTIFAQVPAGL